MRAAAIMLLATDWPLTRLWTSAKLSARLAMLRPMSSPCECHSPAFEKYHGIMLQNSRFLLFGLSAISYTMF